MNMHDIKRAASAFGKLGGSKRSEAKAAAVRKNLILARERLAEIRAEQAEIQKEVSQVDLGS